MRSTFLTNFGVKNMLSAWLMFVSDVQDSGNFKKITVCQGKEKNSEYLLSTFCVLDTVPRAFHIPSLI